MSALHSILIITGVLTGLIAGLFYAFSCSVNGGLAKLTDENYLLAMQSINRTILNPLFFLSFMGTFILLPLSTWLLYRDNGLSAAFYWLLAASLLYIIGGFGITIVGNVPLNEALDKFDISNATAEQITHQRMIFEASWNKFHTIRTIASSLSLILVLMAL